MEIWHRGHIGIENKSFLELNSIKHTPSYNVALPGNSRQIVDYEFEIHEDDPAWFELKNLVGGEHTYVGTLFTETERLSAEWCILRGIHSIESLRPEGYGWHQQYYADQCPKCGVGWQQLAPFRIKKEPRLGKNQFSSFGSGFELFCTLLVVEEFAKSFISGFNIRPLLLGNTDAEVENLKQIVVLEMAEPAIAAELVEHERYRAVKCPVCGKTSHSHYIRGMLPLCRAALKSNVDFQLTNEWFGSGSNARREILVSQRVIQLVRKHKWKGAELIPVQAV
jgi:hypothetical protein